MSSPNLNVVTLLGSGLTYTSAYLFGIQEQSLPSRDSVETLIQVSRAHTNTSVDNGSITSWPPSPPRPPGPALPAVCGDLPGAGPRPGEELAALQGVHPAGAGQAGGE